MDHAAIIEQLGGYLAVAKGLGCHPARVSHWKRAGIPIARWPALVVLAKQAGAPLSFDMLLAGKPAGSAGGMSSSDRSACCA
jgi:hypothetical protein